MTTETPNDAFTAFETVPADEAAQIEEIARLTVELMKLRYPDGMARRGVHPKDHGCVWARFQVDPDIPEAFRAGVFAQPGKTYDAWVRFSNASPRRDSAKTSKTAPTPDGAWRSSCWGWKAKLC